MHICTDCSLSPTTIFFYFDSCYIFHFVFQITFLIISGECAPYGGDSFSVFNDIAQTSHGRVFNMENDDIEIILNDIRGIKFKGFDQNLNKNYKSKRMANADGLLPKVDISPANMSFIEEEQPLIIECNVNTSDAATVLLKHNGEIIHEQHTL